MRNQWFDTLENSNHVRPRHGVRQARKCPSAKSEILRQWASVAFLDGRRRPTVTCHIFSARHEKAGWGHRPPPPPFADKAKTHRTEKFSCAPLAKTHRKHLWPSCEIQISLAANARQSQGSTRSSPTSRSVLPDTGRGTGLSNTLLQLKFKIGFFTLFREMCKLCSLLARARAFFFSFSLLCASSSATSTRTATWRMIYALDGRADG
jgi:hypothetical protein